MMDCTLEKHIPEDQNETVEPETPIDPPKEVTIKKKRPAWLKNTLQKARGHAAPRGSFRETKRPNKFSSYVALMIHIMRRSRWLHQW
jgi:hypothetical protein